MKIDRIIGDYDLNMVEEVWADAETLLPIRIESTYTPVAEDQKKSSGGSKEITPDNRISKSILSDFQYNLKFDEALFSLDPPAGYKLKKYEPTDLPKQEEQPKGESAESEPLNSGRLVIVGEVEEEDKGEAKKEKGKAKETEPLNSGRLMPAGGLEEKEKE